MILDPQKSLPVLIAALAGHDKAARYSTAEALGQIGPQGKAAIVGLARLVGGDPLPGDRAAEALARMGPEGVTALAEVLRAGPDAARAAAAGALGMAGQEASVATSPLVDALRDPCASVRQNAAASLGEVEQASDDVLAALRGAEADPEFMVRLAVRKALQKVATRKGSGAQGTGN